MAPGSDDVAPLERVADTAQGLPGEVRPAGADIEVIGLPPMSGRYRFREAWKRQAFAACAKAGSDVKTSGTASAAARRLFRCIDFTLYRSVL